MAESIKANKGVKIGLLRGAGTRFASWFYAMFRMLRQKLVLLATIHCAEFRALPLKPRMKLAAKDAMENDYYSAMFTLLRAVFAALRALRYADSNTPAMDKIYFFAHRTTLAIQKSAELLNDTDLFGEMGPVEELDFEDEVEQVFGEDNR